MSPTYADRLLLAMAPEVLRDNKEFVLREIARHGNILQHASERLRADQEIVLAAVKKWPANLQYASTKLRANREIVMEAVSRVGFALQFASKELRSDKAVVKEALRTDPQFLIDTPREFLQGVVKLLGNKSEILRHASSDLQEDRELIYLAKVN